MIVHAFGAAPTPADCRTCAPFISHTAALPLVSRQAMSLLLSALKSWELTVVGAKRPIWWAPNSLNHSAPSGPVVMLGPAPFVVGIGNSVITPSVVMRPIWLAIP